MNYWTAVFTHTSWEQRDPSCICWSENRKALSERLRPGDIIIGYIARVGFVGYWRAVSKVQDSPERSPYGSDFPLIAEVEPVVVLAPETACRVEDVPGESPIRSSNSGRVIPVLHQASGTALPQALGEEMVRLLDRWKENPRSRSLTEVQRNYRPRVAEAHEVDGTTVSVPSRDEDEADDEDPTTRITEGGAIVTPHTSAQEKLCRLGHILGFTPWITPDDRMRQARSDGTRLDDLPGVTSELPGQFDAPTTSTIRHIDAMWLTRGRRDRIEAAFEVEHSTSIHSGILRMADLLALQPNLDIPLYLVVPEERAVKAAGELTRPVFQFGMETPLASRARIITYDQLELLIRLADQAGGHLKANVLYDYSYGAEDLLAHEGDVAQ